MLGQKSAQRELFRPDHLYLPLVGEDSLYGFFGKSGRQMFRDSDFSGLYAKEGRPSVPPSQLCVALLLQAREGLSDEATIERTSYDLRWKVALGLEIDEKLCAKSTLQFFRAKLILNGEYQKLFDASVKECQKQGLLKRKKLTVALDTTPIWGRGAVKDTFNLISDQIKTVVREAASLKGGDVDEIVASQGLGRHFGSSYKAALDIDWDDADQKRAVVAQLVGDANVAIELASKSLKGYAKGAEQTQLLREAQQMLADLLLQDIEEAPDDGKGPKIAKRTVPDRIVSVTDPDMRHGRKSKSNRFNGHKASVAVDAESGVFLATDVIPGNAHDSEGAGDLVKKTKRVSGSEVEQVLGDSAYGTTAARADIQKAAKNAEIIAKVPPAPSRRGVEFTVEDFDINLGKKIATCPAGKRSIRYARPKGTKDHRFTFSQIDCKACPLRAKCTSSKKGPRKITLSENYEKLREGRKRQKTKSFKAKYRKRVKVEHRIARLIQLGVRQARYFGRKKVAFQVSMAAAAANMVTLMG